MSYTLPKVAAVHDICGIGRCSLTAAIPILSSMQVQCCPLPTAVLSHHTGIKGFSFYDFTPEMSSFLSSWEKLNQKFDVIYTGFLGSEDQLSIIYDFLRCHVDSSLILVDPVMGDNGKIYKTYTPKMCEDMKKLCELAHIITPNVTEACYLAGIPYQSNSLNPEEAVSLARKLCVGNIQTCIITGIVQGDQVLCAWYDKTKNTSFFSGIKRIDAYTHGTGDLFASVLCGAICNKIPLDKAIKKAQRFVHDAIQFTVDSKAPVEEGIVFEPFLKELLQTEE
jgi:pyridoxine kinase